MSLEVVGGMVQYKYDLGSGAVTLTSDKTVNDDIWHHVIVERYYTVTSSSSSSLGLGSAKATRPDSCVFVSVKWFNGALCVGPESEGCRTGSIRFIVKWHKRPLNQTLVSCVCHLC